MPAHEQEVKRQVQRPRVQLLVMSYQNQQAGRRLPLCRHLCSCLVCTRTRSVSDLSTAAKVAPLLGKQRTMTTMT